MTKEKFWPSLSLLRKFLKDEGGTVLVQFTIYLIGILGMLGLAIDGARMVLVNNNLQELTDAAALAAAAQLDGAQDALTRADTAARSLTTTSSCTAGGSSACPNTPARWFDGAAGTTILPRTAGVQFYSSLDPVNGDTVTTDPKTANYVKVTTGQDWQVAPAFLAGATALLGFAAPSSSISASAMAQGNNIANCVLTQSFVCNPWEGSEGNAGTASNFSSHVSVGQMVTLVDGAGAAGNWGLIEPPAGKSPRLFDGFWSGLSIGSACTTGNSQGNTRPGNVGKFAQDGMNVRFDSPIGNNPPSESVSAPIVIDGFQSSGNGFSCNRIDPNITGNQNNGGNGIPAEPAGFHQTDWINPNTGLPDNGAAYDNACTNNLGSCPLPRDRSFTNVANNNQSPWGLFQLGNGPNSADLQAYWTNHHGGTLPLGVTTRYQIYQREVPVAQGGLGTATFTAASHAAENEGPTCNKSSTGDISRRVLTVAVVDCQYWGISGEKALPATTLVAQFFMTEPAMSAGPGVAGGGTPSGGGIIVGEYMGSSPVDNSNCLANPNSLSCALHKIVQLVR
jgi:Flp pilus assembly protein TadG